MPPRRTFDHAIELKEGAEPPWGPVYPMSQYQLNKAKNLPSQNVGPGQNYALPVTGWRANFVCTKTRRSPTIMCGLQTAQEINDSR